MAGGDCCWTRCPFWPPSGLAIAALFIYGRKYTPYVFLGAFFVNLQVDQFALDSLLPSTLVAIG
ncbi:MAG: hypothetical protein HN509_13870, partial [Halobacteriovoraceae bacterium]|nr:hypothetical protein [Halobacteriovoraceae bacterium]